MLCLFCFVVVGLRMILKPTLCWSVMELPRAWKIFSRKMAAGLLFAYETYKLQMLLLWKKFASKQLLIFIGGNIVSLLGDFCLNLEMMWCVLRAYRPWLPGTSSLLLTRGDSFPGHQMQMMSLVNFTQKLKLLVVTISRYVSIYLPNSTNYRK